MKVKTNNFQTKKNFLEKGFNFSLAKKFSQKKSTIKRNSYTNTAKNSQVIKKRNIPKNETFNFELNQNLILQFLSFTIIVCFTALFFQNILSGTNTLADASSNNFGNNNIKIFTNFNQIEEKSKTKAPTGQLVEISIPQTQKSASSTSNKSQSSDSATIPIPNENKLSGDTSSSKKSIISDQKIYIVKSGQTLSEIAKSQQKTVSELAALNNLEVPYNIKTGQKLIISKD